ncbi:MAG TPA: GDP-mannose 4,6-dehydratase [Acetobacteraceae bacterium]|nr:GDP-mannose 4,6-dehydratase [Acetobacteraceae bacterium]
MQGRKVLVTGAGGFIGSHLVETLAARGAAVRALLHYGAEGGLGNARFLDAPAREAVEWVQGDVLDAEFMVRLAQGCDTVFHLAALIAIPHSYSAPRSFVEVNAIGTLNVLEAARAAGVRRVVQTSTSEVYGSARRIPMDEAHPLQAQSPYAATKIAADKLAEAYHASFGVPVVTVRPFNTYGPRQSARAVIPTVIGQALAGADRIMLGATTPVRDMTFVTDTVVGMITAAEATGVEGRTFNLGTGQGESIGAIAQRILGLIGSRAEIVLDPRRLRPPTSEVDRLIADNAAFRAATGWSPRVSLEQGLAATIAFFRAHPGLLPAAGYAT